MKRSSILLLIFALGLSYMLQGCTASSELEEETADQEMPAAEAPAPTPAPVKQAQPAQTHKQGFTTKEDTIEVESAQRNHRPGYPPAVTARRTAGAPTYRVQVGAFKVEANAQRAAGRLAKRYRKPSACYFDEAVKLFKVTVGTFSTEKDALTFARAMKKKYPKEYKGVWVVRSAE